MFRTEKALGDRLLRDIASMLSRYYGPYIDPFIAIKCDCQACNIVNPLNKVSDLRLELKIILDGSKRPNFYFIRT